MSNDYLASVALIAAIRNYGFIPEGDAGSSQAMMLDIMNRESRVYLSGILIGARDEYLLASQDISLVASQAAYSLPSSAIAAAFRRAELVSSNGDVTALYPVLPEESSTSVSLGSSAPGDYYLKGNKLVLLVVPTTSAGSLRVWFRRRMNKVVPATSCIEVASISGSDIVAVDELPGDFVDAASGDDLEFIQGTPHFDVITTADFSSMVASTKTVTLVDAVPSTISVGDFLCFAGQTPIVNAPLELHDLLVARAVYVYLLARGDPKATAARDYMGDVEERVKSLIQPRIESDSGVLLDTYGAGWDYYRRRNR